ncbi:unnamed protein product [Sphagnum balticum]
MRARDTELDPTVRWRIGRYVVAQNLVPGSWCIRETNPHTRRREARGHIAHAFCYSLLAARYSRHAGALIPSLDVSPTSRRCSWDSAFFGFLYGNFWRSVAFFVRLCVRWKDGQRN